MINMKEKWKEAFKKVGVYYKETETTLKVPAIVFAAIDPTNTEFDMAKEVELIFTSRGKFVDMNIIK